MQVFSTPNKIIITCHKWLAPALNKELLTLGYTPVKVFQTGVELRGTVQDCIKLNLNLRCASQVMYALESFTCNDPNELYQHLVKFPWEKLLPQNGYFSVTSNVFHPTIKTNLFANLKVKDAIVDRMRTITHQRPLTGASLQGAVFYLFWKNNEAEIFIDTSGETLAKHGYRKLPGTAPMLEALAAATILSTRWDKKSAFVNPMCGSGTLAIEAALIATNRMPGLWRDHYAFMHILGYKKEMYELEKLKLKEQIIKLPSLQIIATDISKRAIEVAKANAKVAGVDHLIYFKDCPFEKTNLPAATEGAVVMFNPEYGERLGESSELGTTYAQMGDFLKNTCKGYTGYIFTGNMELAKKVRLKPSKRIEFYNATIDCRLLEYELYEGTKREIKN